MISGTALRVLCVGRHAFLSEHIARFFAELGLDTFSVVGLDEAVRRSRGVKPQVVLCDYDLLATLSLESWEHDELLSRTPVIAVSLTRRPNEVHVLDVNGIAGFLYLPTLEPAIAYRILNAATASGTGRLPISAMPNSTVRDGPSQSPLA